MDAEQDRQDVWAQMAEKFPYFTKDFDTAGNHHAVREIVLGGSVTWAGVWKRFTPRSGMNVMDIGANAGIFSAFCMLNGCSVVAYEPFADAFNLLCKIPRVGPFYRLNRAVWKHTGYTKYLGTASLIEGSEPAFNGSVLSDGINWNDGDLATAKAVECVSLDDAIGLAIWDMVKIDIEGAECEVLLAASDEALRRIKFMYLELHPWTSQALYDETIKKLESVFRFEGAYWNHDIARWEAAYLHAKS